MVLTDYDLNIYSHLLDLTFNIFVLIFDMFVVSFDMFPGHPLDEKDLQRQKGDRSLTSQHP